MPVDSRSMDDVPGPNRTRALQIFTSRSSTRPSPSAHGAPAQSRMRCDYLLGRVKDGRREQDRGGEDPVVPGVEPEEVEGKRGNDKHHPDSAIDPKVQRVGNDADEPSGMIGQ